MITRVLILFLITFTIIACSTNNSSTGNKISFDQEKSMVNYVRHGKTKLLTIDYFLINESNNKIGPFTMKMNITNPKLLDFINEDKEEFPILYGEKVTLDKSESHGYGAGTFEIKNEIPLNDLREIIEDNRSIEIQLINESGDIIISDWIQKLNIVGITEGG
ncbi:hypothetical protein [Paenibacillus naphthalenovorans]|uniref:hypothetical protein n=1 Tax=Paenibacillus naphthalenovorans TaxID=162209 RepID=UPI0008815C9E|nr:hypothetical protein [Paenibacillus naphthalenovorans]SDJ93878.1 hypothetical protein SAMN05421868_1608 [Paenibacillus naphthalenovorans]